MKKILVSMFAVAALAACSTEHTVVAPQNEAIGFDTFVDNATRATDITTGDLAEFGVYASIENASGAGMILTNEKVSKSGDVWSYGNIQYWVPQAMYEFTAFAPYTNADITPAVTAHWTYVPATTADNGVVTFNNQNAAADQDFIFAAADRDMTNVTALQSQPEKVSFTFAHELSKIAFKFNNGFNAVNNITLRVYNVNVAGLVSEATENIIDGVAYEWTKNGDATFARTFGAQAQADATVIAALGNYTTDHHYFIPVAGTKYTITFDVDLIQAGVTVDTYHHTINTIPTLAKGGSYMFTTTLDASNVSDDPTQQLYPIEFTVNDVEGWDAESSVELAEPTEVATAAKLATAIAEGGEIRLTSDITLSGSELRVAEDKEVNLDLNGNTLTVAALDPIDNYGKMTIANGKIVAGYAEETRRCIYNKEGGEMVINNVEFVQTYDKKGAAINNEGKMTINNAKVDAVFYSVWTSGANAETIINGGTYTSMNNEAIRDTWSYAVIALNNAKLIINGGTFTGNHGVVSATYGAEATLNAGTFHCTCTYTGNSDWVLYTSYASGDEVPGTIKYNEANCTFTTARTDGKIYYSACESHISKF